jgi:phosphoglycerate dehydrogenase-like enzyme
MYGNWKPLPLTDDQREELAELCEVVDWTPLGRFDDERASDVLGRVEILFGHWGCPLLDERALELAPELRLLAYAGGTVKSVVTPAVFEREVAVTSAAAANAVPVAEYTLAVILLANKNAFVARELVRGGAETPHLEMQTPGNFDKTVGIIGASHVGRLVFELLVPFELDVLVSDPFLGDAEAIHLDVEKVELDELLTRSDVVSVHAPALPSTAGMIGARELGLLRDGAVFVNTARGALVDHDALVAELRTGRISAVLDVTDPHEPLPADSPLLALPNVFVTPHLAGSQGTELVRLAELAIDEIQRFVSGDPLLHQVHREDLGRIA